MDFLTIFWGADLGFDIGGFTIRYYSLLFAAGFILGYQLMKRIYIKEGIDLKYLDKLLTYAVIATVVGARLGHCFFYDWDYYGQHPLEILKVWKGGLASHGAAIALIFAMYLFGKQLAVYFENPGSVRKGMLYALDRLVITVALAGCFIRFGNWMNSEIYGQMGNSEIETVFTRLIEQPMGQYGYESYFDHAEVVPTGETYATDSIAYPVLKMTVTPRQLLSEQQIAELFPGIRSKYNNRTLSERNAIVLPDATPTLNSDGTFSFEILGIPRLPTQLIESSAYLIIFVILFVLYQNPKLAMKNGFLFGTFLVLVFGFRFVVEYWKADQSAFEADMSLNMGQWLSIPLVLIGLVMMAISKEVKLKTKIKE